jgi:choline dehydrogenase
MMTKVDADCDFVVVGSGAGGGTLAARLVEAGMRVVLLEAGSDARASGGERMPEDYDVPAFHPMASENPEMSWDFFVRHYADDARQSRDPKARADGVLYPRAATLGGCTAHNAMILIRPPDADWDAIASLTGDASWSAAAMREHWERLENCRHRPIERAVALAGINPTGHGWHGWLPTERAMPIAAFSDHRLVLTALEAAGRIEFGSTGWLGRLGELLEGHGDPNDRRTLNDRAGGLCYTPLTTDNHTRTGTRERLLEVAARFPDRLRIELDALATHVILDDDNRARGVSWLKGRNLYRASREPSGALGETRQVTAAREVILCGGAFNSPQLLMLSGIGPAGELARHGIAARVDLPGVGRGLQDRYEIGVVNRMAKPWSSLAGADFTRADPLFQLWAHNREGMYASNGAMLAVQFRSPVAGDVPDVFCMALLGRFNGYYPGYSRQLMAHHDYLTWAILKGYTRNLAGEVTLRSADPRDPPAINFHYFEEAGEGAEEDLKAVIAAIRFVRGISAGLVAASVIAEEESPGADIQSDAELADFVRDTAWGHHASCSCPIGAQEAGGVVDSEFRVHGTKGLRIVDASVFPRIPGFFIASAVYLVAEKAARTILEQVREEA